MVLCSWQCRLCHLQGAVREELGLPPLIAGSVCSFVSFNLHNPYLRLPWLAAPYLVVWPACLGTTFSAGNVQNVTSQKCNAPVWDEQNLQQKWPDDAVLLGCAGGWCQAAVTPTSVKQWHLQPRWQRLTHAVGKLIVPERPLVLLQQRA